MALMYYEYKRIMALKEENIRVAVSGVVVDKADNSLLLDDGTGRIRVFIGEDLKTGTLFRIFGRLIMNEYLELHADFIQDMSKVDKNLHKKVLDLMA